MSYLDLKNPPQKTLTHSKPKTHQIRIILIQVQVLLYRLFKNGIIYNVIVDEYVPSCKGYHVFTGPANEVEVYPMLLEKAIAKLCGSYS